MNTEKHSSKTKKYMHIRVLPWLIPILLVGCKPEEQKSLPQDRLTVIYSIDRETIQIGDPVELILTAYFPTNGVLKLPEIGRNKDVVLLKRDWTTLPREDGLTQSESRYSITSFRLGHHAISTNPISCISGNETFTTNFPSVVLTVETSLTAESTSEIADLKPVQKLKGRIPSWIWISLLVALIAFLIGLISSKLWKHRAVILPQVPVIPPHVLAIQALADLKRKGLLENEECNPFYTELSLILRTYLDGRFSLNAPEETTEEIIEQLSTSPELDGNQRNILQDFMRQADMVKFAKGHPDRSTMEAAFDTTEQFVEQTKFIEEPVPEIKNQKSEITTSP